MQPTGTFSLNLLSGERRKRENRYQRISEAPDFIFDNYLSDDVVIRFESDDYAYPSLNHGSTFLAEFELGMYVSLIMQCHSDFETRRFLYHDCDVIEDVG